MDPYYETRLRSDKPISFLGFIDILRKLWEAAGKPGTIKREAPIKDEAEYPMVTFKTKSRQVNPEFKDYKPRLRTTIRHPHEPNEFIELYGQVFDVLVEFGVFSKSAEEADEMIMELEDFMHLYAGFFKQQGVQEIRFYEQGEDEILSENRYSIAKRTVQYIIRFEKITPRFLNQIQNLAIQANIVHDINQEEKEEES